MTRLRKTMLEELQRRNYSPTTVKAYLHTVEAFAKHFHRLPDQLGPNWERVSPVQKRRFCRGRLPCPAYFLMDARSLLGLSRKGL